MTTPRKLSHTEEYLRVALPEFGTKVTRKLRSGIGSPEDHLRGPIERIIEGFSASLGMVSILIGETILPALAVRPDYAVDVDGARVGYIELKRPGRGVPPSWASPSVHDRAQWQKLSLLPNVLYTDGQEWALIQSGELRRKARLSPDLDRAGKSLHCVDRQLENVLSDFLLWKPERPKTLTQLVRSVANLCRLLREDVNEEIRREHAGESREAIFTELAEEWRQLLFPRLSDVDFADAYAQTVTFALLLARVEGVDFTHRAVGEIALLLGKKHSLMGKALSVLTQQPVEAQSVVIDTMLRVLGVVEWSIFPEDSYSALYEQFLEVYDPAIRKKSGAYYTPQPVVRFLTRFIDELLSVRLGRPLGLADNDVIVVDPAMGTGSFLAEVIDSVAQTMRAEEGPGSVAPHLRQLSKRLIGFEKQVAPFAVAELRIHGKLRAKHRAEVPAEERRFLADTLDDPDLQALPLGSVYKEIANSRTGANKVKLTEPVMVVFGNPPYGDKVRPGFAPWLQDRGSDRQRRPNIDAFRAPGNGAREQVLSNLSILFWRWATWKVFDAHPEHPTGIVGFITTAAYTTGPGFAGMREYLRRTTDEGWIVDLSPEGHQPPINTRVFRATQHEICIGVFVRSGSINKLTPALIHYTSIDGTATEKFAKLSDLQLDGHHWIDCPTDWQAPFAPAGGAVWSDLPTMTDAMPWSASGVKTNRTWIYSPSESTLNARWLQIIRAAHEEKAVLFKESRDANLTHVKASLFDPTVRQVPFGEETTEKPPLVLAARRAFDRQWIIADSRLMHTPSLSLWLTYGSAQIYVTEQHRRPLAPGPALLFSSSVPDMDHFMGHHGGRVLPLYRDPAGTVPNIAPGLLEFLGLHVGHAGAEDLIAYIAAVTSHPAYVDRFDAELKRDPGVRLPITRDAELWQEALNIGREVLWLHTFGERFVNRKAGRPPGSPKLHDGRPKVLIDIPDTEDQMPERVDYRPETNTLIIGTGSVAPISAAIWDYTVGGNRVVERWFDYRKKNPIGKRGSPLNEINAEFWSPGMTTALLDLLNVLGRCIEIESRQSMLLDRILDGPLVTRNELGKAGILPAPDSCRKPPKNLTAQTLFELED